MGPAAPHQPPPSPDPGPRRGLRNQTRLGTARALRAGRDLAAGGRGPAPFRLEPATMVRVAGRRASRFSRTRRDHRHDVLREDRARGSGSARAARARHRESNRSAGRHRRLYAAARPPRRDRLMAAGRTVGIRPGGYRALDSLRMEKGYRYYGTDLTLLDNPLEAGLGFCVRFDKGDFNGRDALVAARAAGIARRLRTLLVGDQEYLTVYGGEAVYAEGSIVGRLRSCAYGFSIRRNIAYSYLPVALGPGTPVEVEVFGRRVPAEVQRDAVLKREQPVGEDVKHAA